MSQTYLHTCMKEEYLCRWPDGAMPIRVYIAPFTWYEKKKQQESLMYRQMVMDALQEWHRASDGLIRFTIVDNLNHSQIDFKWRRVDRKSLGHCVYEMDDRYRLFSAGIQIGISDGLLHADYQQAGEVKHTILHEIGHALGLIDHSDDPNDIMYVPHQFGVHQLSPRDKETIKWLYTLPVSFHYKSIGRQYNLKSSFGINDVIHHIETKIKGQEPISSEIEETGFSQILSSSQSTSSPTSLKSLDEQHQILSEMGRFYLKTQNIQVDKNKQNKLREIMTEKKHQNRFFKPENQ